MKTLFKKLDITGVAVLLLAFFVAVGFKAKEMRQNTQWYEITITDTNNPHDTDNQEIGIVLPGGPSSPCLELSVDTLCAVQLHFEDEDTEIPETVAAVDTSDGVSIQSLRYKPAE